VFTLGGCSLRHIMVALQLHRPLTDNTNVVVRLVLVAVETNRRHVYRSLFYQELWRRLHRQGVLPLETRW
jgi:hypothetical protein